MALALVCAYNRTEHKDVQDLLNRTLTMVSNGFLDKQAEGNGIIGNIYSTGLAMQLLLAAGKFYAPRPWDCTQPVAAITAQHLQQPMAVAQALPALVGRTYLDSASLDCSPEAPTTAGMQLDTVLTKGTTPEQGIGCHHHNRLSPPPPPLLSLQFLTDYSIWVCTLWGWKSPGWEDVAAVTTYSHVHADGCVFQYLLSPS